MATKIGYPSQQHFYDKDYTADGSTFLSSKVSGPYTSDTSCIKDEVLQSCFLDKLGDSDPINTSDARKISSSVNEEKVMQELSWIFKLIRRVSETGGYDIRFPLEMTVTPSEADMFRLDPDFSGKVKVNLSQRDSILIGISGDINKYKIAKLKDLGYQITLDKSHSPVSVTKISWDISEI